MPGRKDKSEDAGLVGSFLKGVGESTRHNSLAYGYSLALTGAFGIAATVAGTPTPVDIILWAFGAALTFSIMNAAVTRGFRVKVEDEPPIVVAFGTSLGFLSVTA